MPGQKRVKVEDDEQDGINQRQSDTTAERALSAGSMQNITSTILQKEQAYLSRINDLTKVVAEQAEKLSCYKRRVEEYKDVTAMREDAQQMLLRADAKAAQNDMDMQRAELMLHGADMKLHNAQFKMDEAGRKMAEANKMMESAKEIKEQTQQMVVELNSYHGALKECSNSIIQKLNKIEGQRSPSVFVFPIKSE